MNFIGHGTVVKTSASGTCVREMLMHQGDNTHEYKSLTQTSPGWEALRVLVPPSGQPSMGPLDLISQLPQLSLQI